MNTGQGRLATEAQRHRDREREGEKEKAIYNRGVSASPAPLKPTQDYRPPPTGSLSEAATIVQSREALTRPTWFLTLGCLQRCVICGAIKTDEKYLLNFWDNSAVSTGNYDAPANSS
jgi:hypothetical protein